MKTLLIALGLLILPIAPSVASEEENVQWTSVRIEGHGHDPLGDVVFAANTNEGKLSLIQINAFGRQYQLDAAQIEQIKTFQLDSLKITHEGGYAILGGHTVHFKLGRMSRDDKGEIVYDDVVISVPQNAEMTFSIRRR